MTFSSGGIDSMSMMDLLKMEIASQCVSLTQDLSALEDNPHSVEHLASFQRALHSLKGAARIVDMQPIIRLIQKIEESTSDISLESTSLTPIVPALRDVVSFLSQFSKEKNDNIQNFLVRNNRAILTIIKTLGAFHSSAADTKKQEPKKRKNKPLIQDTPRKAQTSFPANLLKDQSLFAIFKEDAENQCALLNDSLLQLEENPHDSRFLEASMRSTHSIKGAARVIELHQIVELAHSMEDLLVKVLEKQCNLLPSHIDTLLRAVDFLKEFIEVDAQSLPNWYRENIYISSEIIQELADCGQGALHTGEFRTPSEQSSSESIAAGDVIASDPQPSTRLSDFDRHIKISSSGLNRLMGLTNTMMREAKWQPSLLAKTIQLKKSCNDFGKQIEKIRKKFHESHFDQQIELSFQQLHKQTRALDDTFKNYISEIEDHAISANEISHQIHKEMLKNKMQPFSEGIKGLPRMVRDLAKKQNKNIRFEVSGAQTLVDRDILEKIESPLYHLIANAIDHGIESVSERASLGKDIKSTIRVEAQHRAGTLKITVADDGRGLDMAKLRSVIIEKKLATKKIAQQLSDAELTEFIFLPNFTTKDKVSRLSGRGVGLDVVHSTIKQLRGSISLSSVAGSGSLFELILPLSLSLTRAITCLINDELYAVPLVNVEYVTKIKQTELLEIDERQYIVADDKRIDIVSAQQVLDLTEPSRPQRDLPTLILQGTKGVYGIVVDRLLGVKELIVHPISPRLGKLRSINSAAITEDGIPILILDKEDIIQSIDHLLSGNRLHKIDRTDDLKARDKSKKILVVDDSATVREVERKLLSDSGYAVTTAEDGLDAWNTVKDEKFDLIITDIDMPNMDGIEFLLQVREDHDLHDIPVIIVSYKDRKEDRLKGLNAGADYYLTKGSFQDQTLLDAIFDLVGSPTDD